MILLSDNDLVGELARCDLFDSFLVWLEVPPNEVWVLPTLKYVMGKKLRGDAPALQALHRFLPKVKEMPAASEENLKFFLDCDGIDVGEQAMFATLLDQPEARMLTGDKNALRALARDVCETHDRVREAVAQRIRCLESVFVALIESLGFDLVNEKVIAGTSKNVVIRMAFGHYSSSERALGYLQEYRAELNAQCGGLLH